MRVFSVRRLALSLCASAGVAALCAPAQAQDASGSQATASMVGEVVVTATRREEALKEVPMSIDVVTGQQLNKLNIFDFHDVSQLAPGLQLTNNDGRSNVATLRGITYDPDSGAPPAVDLYVNEFPIDAQTALSAVYDVGQIEVLRGPQGIFRGRTSPAGSITLTTRKPSLSSIEGYVQASGSDLDAENFQGAVSIPLVQDKLAVRFAGLFDHNRSNSVRNVTLGEDRSRSRTESYRISVAFAPTDTFSGNLTYQYLHSDIRPYVAVFGPGSQPSLLGPQRSGPPISIDDRMAVSEGAPRFQNRSHVLTFASNTDLDWSTFSVNLGYQSSILDQFRDQDIWNAVPGYDWSQHVVAGYKVFNADVRLASNGSDRFTWMIGGTYYDSKNFARVNQRNDTFFGIPGLTPIPAGVASLPTNVFVYTPPASKSYSAFATLGYRVTDKLRLQGGIRYTAYKVSQQSFLTVSLPTLGLDALNNFPTVTAEGESRSYHPITGGVSINYDITPDVATYFSWGHSYRTGTAAVGVTTPLDTALLVSQPEKSDSYELGLKAEFWNRRISFNGDIFYQTFANYIGHLPTVYTSSARNGVLDASTAPINTNGDAISAGIEATASLRLDQLDASMSASYVDAHYDNAQLPCNVFDAAGNPVVPVGQQVATCTRDDRISQVPKFNLSSTAEYRFGEVRNVTPFIRGLVTYRPAFNSTLDNFNYPAFTNVNLYLGVRGPQNKWELSVWSKNLLDQARPLRVSDAIGVIPTLGVDPVTFAPTGAVGPFFSSGYRNAVITTPREFGVTFLANF